MSNMDFQAVASTVMFEKKVVMPICLEYYMLNMGSQYFDLRALLKRGERIWSVPGAEGAK